MILIYVGVPEFTIEELFNKHCCNRKTLTCFKLLSYADIEKTRRHYYDTSDTETEQSQKFIDYFIQLIIQFSIPLLESLFVKLVGVWYVGCVSTGFLL